MTPLAKKDRRPTLDDVAEAAGVSRATASLVVRNSDKIAEKTRVKVNEAMRTIGYVYNRVAAGLRSQNCGIIGLVITDLTNPFFAEMTAGIEAELESTSFALYLTTTSDDHQKQKKSLESLLMSQVTGMLICPSRGTTIDDLIKLKDYKLQ